MCLVGTIPDSLRPVLGAHTAYVVGDDDPLAAVADAWVRLFEESGPIGELEVVIADAVARWRARSIELPDYYLVAGLDELTPTRRHWYFGVLHTAAPGRVIPVTASPSAVLEALQALSSGPWWPPLDRLLAGLEHRAPDVGGPAAAPAGPTLVPPARPEVTPRRSAGPRD